MQRLISIPPTIQRAFTKLTEALLFYQIFSNWLFSHFILRYSPALMAASSVLLANSVQQMGKFINVLIYNVTGLWLAWHVENRDDPTETVDQNISASHTHTPCVFATDAKQYLFGVLRWNIPGNFGQTMVGILARGITGYQDKTHNFCLTNCRFGYGHKTISQIIIIEVINC